VHGLGQLVLGGPSAAATRDDLVVMIDARQRDGVARTFGAGIIVSQSAARTIIATALHVISNEDGDLAADVQVEFNSLRGRLFRASPMASYVDQRMDLGVLFIEHGAAPDVPRSPGGGSMRVLSPTSPDKLAGARVQVIGAETRTGASGGGLFDSFGRLLGMCSRIDSTSSELPIAALIERLRRWNIDIGLLPADAASTSPELMAQMRQGLHIEADPLRARFPPATGGNQRFPHRLTARLSPALQELSPSIQTVFSNHLAQRFTKTLTNEIDGFARRPPEYSV